MKSGIKRYFFNTSWVMAERVFRMPLVLIITICIARYLGPQQFGQLNYAISFVELFSIVSTLGINLILFRVLGYVEDGIDG